MARKDRLNPGVFDIPVDKIRRGYYSAVYFWREKVILESQKYDKRVLMQVFQKKDSVLCGTDEAVAVLKQCIGYYRNHESAFRLFDRYLEKERELRMARWIGDIYKLERSMRVIMDMELELGRLWENKFGDLAVKSLYDGEQVVPWETIMTIEGLPQYFSHLESVYLGILARRTLVATNVSRVVEAAGGKPILFFADRFDHYENQTGDGYAATVGGAYGVATDIMGEWWGKKGMGTTPHALIACFGGDTAEATVAFAKQYPDVSCISLVDFHNDCATTALEVAERFKREGLKLWGVRLDTSENMVDQSLIRNNQLGSEKPTGVNSILVANVRNALDVGGYNDVKIVASGGFNEEKVKAFENQKVPVDAYGVGSSLLKGGNDFTAAIVLVNGEPMAKTGRQFRPNPKLTRVEG